MAFHTATGGDNRVSYGDHADWDGNTAMSWAYHVNPDTLVDASRMIAKGTGNTDPWNIFMRTSGVISLLISNGTTFSFTDSTNVLVAGQDNTVVVSWDGSNVTFTINGAAETIALSETMQAGADVLSINNRTAGTLAMDGVMEHVMLWNVALTANEALSYHNGMIPRPSSLTFWNPCYIDTMPDLITGNAATKTGTVAIEDGFTENIPRFPPNPGFFGIAALTALLKVIDEDEEIPETLVDLLGLLEVINEDEEISTTAVDAGGLGLLKIINETLEVNDGDSKDVWDPDGLLTETMSDSTVWKTKFPPFVKRTKWTSA